MSDDKYKRKEIRLDKTRNGGEGEQEGIQKKKEIQERFIIKHTHTHTHARTETRLK